MGIVYIYMYIYIYRPTYHWGVPHCGCYGCWVCEGSGEKTNGCQVDWVDVYFFSFQNPNIWGILFGYGSIPIDTFLVGWTSIYQLFWGSLGTRVLTHPHFSMNNHETMLVNWTDYTKKVCAPAPDSKTRTESLGTHFHACQELSVTDIPSSKDADKNLARFWLMKRLMGVIKHCVQSFRRLVVEVFRFVLLFPIEDNSWFWNDDIYGQSDVW